MDLSIVLDADTDRIVLRSGDGEGIAWAVIDGTEAFEISKCLPRQHAMEVGMSAS